MPINLHTHHSIRLVPVRALLVFAVLFLVSQCFAEDSLQVKITPIERPVVNHAFQVGEKLVFSVEFGAVVAGTATLEVLSVVPVNRRNAYLLRAEAKSSKGFDLIYRVRDRMESYADTALFHTLKFVKKLREGNYKDEKVVEYDHAEKKATTFSWGKDVEVTDIDSLTVDILSALYLVRLMPLEVGEPIYFPVHDIKKRYPLMVDVQKKEKITVPAGTFNCVVVEPKLQSEGIFKRKGRIWVWLTDDEKKMPVKMASELPFGSIVCNLMSYK